MFVLPPSGRLLRTVDLSPFDDGWPKVLEAGGCKGSRGWVVGQRPENGKTVGEERMSNISDSQ